MVVAANSTAFVPPIPNAEFKSTVAAVISVIPSAPAVASSIAATEAVKLAAPVVEIAPSKISFVVWVTVMFPAPPVVMS